MAFRHRALAATTTAVLTAGLLIPSATAQEGELTGVTGTVDWNFKDSFLSYVTSGFAGGAVTVSDGATWEKGQPFTFPIDAENTTVTDNDTAVIELGGEVNFNAHGGILDTTVSDFTLHVDGTTGSLYVDYSSKPMSMEPGEEAVVEENVHFVDIVFDEPVDFSAPLNLTGATTLVEDGVPVFTNYSAGDAFSDLVLDTEPTFAEPTEPEEPADPEDPANPEDPADPEEPTAPGGSADGSSAGSSTEEGGFLSQLFGAVSGIVGIGALGAVIASIVQHFTKLVG